MQWRRTATPQMDEVTSETVSPHVPRRKRIRYALMATVSVGLIWWLWTVDTVDEIVETQTSANNGYIGDDYKMPPPPSEMAPAPTRAAATATPPSPAPPVEKEPSRWIPDINIGGPGYPPAPPTTAFQASQGIRKASATVAASGDASAGVQGAEGSQAAPRSADRLDDNLSSGTDGGTIRATVLPDRHLFLTMGTPIVCDMQQAIDTQLPGPFRCKVKGDVKGASGAVTLLDDGTWAFGRISKTVERGMDRAFAVVTRLETPTGCLVKLRAPVGDQLGAAGIAGDIDTHFFERFRGIALMAFLDAAGQAAAIAASNAIGANSGISFNQFESGSRQLSQGTFSDDVNIPSTLKRSQAATVLVMPIDDIDMTPCFSLRAIK